MTKPNTLNVMDENSTCQKEMVIAMVTQTGFQTAKGKLVLSILHPKPNQFSFYSDSMKFLLFMFLFGLAGISYSLYNQVSVFIETTVTTTTIITTITIIITTRMNSSFHGILFTTCH